MSAPAENGVGFYSEVALDFHASYSRDANRRERMRVWNQFLDRYATGAAFAYDVGCGSGVLACAMAERGIESIGIDGASGMLTIARRTARERGLANLSFQQHHLPISDTSAFRAADLVTSSSAIEYLDSIPEALRFLHNLVKESGVVVFSISNHDSLSRKLVRMIHRLTGRPRYLKFLRHFMTVDEIKRNLAGAELEYLEHAYFGSADRLNRFLSHFLSPRMASNMIIVVARSRVRFRTPLSD
jgi:2-polyprenyl-3-methyl-5-hydroxy-6-metoxy-1,4-benzoquinol methylase